MLLVKIAQNSAKNVEDEKIYYEIIDSHFKNSNCEKSFCDKVLEVKKVLRFYVRYISFLKRVKENNLEFIMTILHDIKNPMISVDYALRAIKRNDEILENVYRTNRSMLNLIEDLLSDYKFDLSIQKLKMEKINLIDILEDEIYHYSYFLKEKNITILKNTEDNLEIFSDKNAISRLFSNLISNAIKSSKSNSTIEIKLKKTFSNVCFEIKNEHCGLKLNKNIFKKFYFQSTSGLGLYIVRKILDKISGKIKIENARNFVIFKIYLPINLGKKQ